MNLMHAFLFDLSYKIVLRLLFFLFFFCIIFLCIGKEKQFKKRPSHQNLVVPISLKNNPHVNHTYVRE